MNTNETNDLMAELDARQKNFSQKLKIQNEIFDILGKSKCYTESHLDENNVMIFTKFFGRKNDISSLRKNLESENLSSYFKISEDVIEEHLLEK